jgi:hypothetical protein
MPVLHVPVFVCFDGVQGLSRKHVFIHVTWTICKLNHHSCIPQPRYCLACFSWQMVWHADSLECRRHLAAEAAELCVQKTTASYRSQVLHATQNHEKTPSAREHASNCSGSYSTLQNKWWKGTTWVQHEHVNALSHYVTQHHWGVKVPISRSLPYSPHDRTLPKILLLTNSYLLSSCLANLSNFFIGFCPTEVQISEICTIEGWMTVGPHC